MTRAVKQRPCARIGGPLWLWGCQPVSPPPPPGLGSPASSAVSWGWIQPTVPQPLPSLRQPHSGHLADIGAPAAVLDSAHPRLSWRPKRWSGAQPGCAPRFAAFFNLPGPQPFLGGSGVSPLLPVNGISWMEKDAPSSRGKCGLRKGPSASHSCSCRQKTCYFIGNLAGPMGLQQPRALLSAPIPWDTPPAAAPLPPCPGAGAGSHPARLGLTPSVATSCPEAQEGTQGQHSAGGHQPPSKLMPAPASLQHALETENQPFQTMR